MVPGVFPLTRHVTEPLPACPTLERLLPSVSPHVLLEVAGHPEPSPAPLHLARVGAVACVGPVVSLQVGHVPERLAADGTQERFLARVGPYVGPEVVRL